MPVITVNSPAGCAAAGGSVLDSFETRVGKYRPNGSLYTEVTTLYRCAIPEAQSVPTSITVSPQISPVFQQQFQPQNSPATAGTTQTQAPITTVTPPAQLPPAPAPMAAPEYVAPPQYGSAPQQLPPAPLPATVQETAPGSAPNVQIAPSGFDWRIAAVIGASLIGVMVLSKRK